MSNDNRAAREGLRRKQADANNTVEEHQASK